MTALTAKPGPALDRAKFQHPDVTADGSDRASVALSGLQTLWFNTGTLCNLTCENCYIESSPTNDRLSYLSLGDVVAYLDEIERDGLPTTEIGFTGGEPFMNPDFCAMLDAVLSRGYQALVLTNAMRPMMKCRGRAARSAGAVRRPAAHPRLARSLPARAARAGARRAFLETGD